MPRRPIRRGEPLAFDRLQERLWAPSLELARAADRVVRAASPAEPSARAWTRAYGIDKMLAWKVMRLRESIDPAGVLGHLPGRDGIRVIARGLRRGGCADQVVSDFERAALELWDLLGVHGVDRRVRSTLAAGTLDSRTKIRARRRDRRALRIAGERLWGVGAAVRITSFLLAPSTVPGMIDLAQVSMFDGLRILSRGDPWCIFDPSVNFEVPSSDPDAAPPGGDDAEGTSPAGGPLVRGHPLGPLIVEHCDAAARGVVVRHPTSGTRHLYLDRDRAPLGEPMRLAIGESIPLLGSMHAALPGEVGMINTRVLTPVATLVVELLLHRDLPPPATNPTGLGFMRIGPQQRRDFEPPMRIPIDAEVARGPVHPLPLAKGEAAVARRGLLDLAAESLGATIADFECHRIVVGDPILGSTMSLRWRLPSPP